MHPWLTAVPEKSQPYEEKKCVAVVSRLSLRDSLRWAGARAARRVDRRLSSIQLRIVGKGRVGSVTMRNISEVRGD